MKRIKRIGTMLLLVVAAFSLLSLPAAAEGDDAVSEVGFAERALAFVRAHLPALLSALTLLGTAILTHIFKTSLLPILERGVGRLDGGVESFCREARELLEAAREESSRLEAGIVEMQRAEAERTAQADALEALLVRIRTLGESELAMLKEVFTAARLPAASKLALEELYRTAVRSEDET